MHLIAGLGNYGSEYLDTRHNAGFRAVDFISQKFDISLSEKTKFNAELGQGYISNKSNKHKIILAKPLTYMNLSAKAIAPICSYYKIPPKNIIIIHDDIDLKFGVVKYKLGGGNGGHNGLKSLDSTIGRDYHRIRIGVGRPENNRIDISDYVLQNFSTDESIEIDSKISQLVDKIHHILNEDYSLFSLSSN
jgi:PTH1 family peptidyl-tRNA hydrolase